MSINTNASKYAVASFNPHDQTLEHIQATIATIAGRGGCPRCGLIAVLAVEFQGDPPAQLGKQGVLSYREAGLAG